MHTTVAYVQHAFVNCLKCTSSEQLD